MKKKVFVLLLIGLLPAVSFAQSQSGFGLGMLKSTQKGALVFLGGEIYAKREISEGIRGVVNIGFYNNTEETFLGKQSINTIPISVGLDYSFLTDKIRPYVGVNAGLMLTLASNSFGSDSGFDPAITPLVGVDYAFNERFGLNINFKYAFALYRDESTSGPDFISFISPNVGVIYSF